MTFENTKKKIMTLKFVMCILINVLKLRELHTTIASSSLINNLNIIKDLTKVSYNILTFNLISVFYNTVPLLLKLRKFMKRNKE